MESLSRYQILAEVGRGGMGVVHHAFDPVLGRPVAIKSVSLAGSAVPEEISILEERLMREARAAATLAHPNIVAVYDVIQEDDDTHIVMEFVLGRTLEQELARNPDRPVEWRLHILEEAASALDYAHSRGVFHRDIKPANIMIDLEDHVRIADFGIAKLAGQKTLTEAGMVLGSPHYSTPEQLRGEPATGRTDQFALAAVAYSLLTGRRPFEGDTMARLFNQILTEQAPVPTSLNPALNSAVDAVLRRAMAKDPAERFESCTEFVRALKQAMAPVAQPGMVARKPPKFPWIPLVAVCLVVLAGVAASLFLAGGRKAPGPAAEVRTAIEAPRPPQAAPPSAAPPIASLPLSGPAGVVETKKKEPPKKVVGKVIAAGGPKKADKTFLWVLDRTYSLRVLDEAGSLIRDIAKVSIDLKIGGNRVLAASPNGKFAVAAGAYRDASRLARYNLDGSTSWTIQDGQYTAVDVAGSVYAIKTANGLTASVLQKINCETGQVEREILLPRRYFDIAVNESNNNVWVAGQVVTRLDLDLKEEWTGSPVGWYVVSIDYAADGALFAAERQYSGGRGQNRLLRIDSAGQVQSFPLEFSPSRVTVNRKLGDVWVVGMAAPGGVARFSAADPAGSLPATFPVGQAVYADVSPDGSLWIALKQKNALVRISRDGATMNELPGVRADSACIAVRTGDPAHR